MNTADRSARALTWTARITGTLLLAFLLFMLVGHLTGDANGPGGMTFTTTRDVLAFALFPVCMILGLALAYTWELLGGAVVLGSMSVLFLVRPDLFNFPLLALLVPGFLYFLSGWMRMRSRRTGNT